MALMSQPNGSRYQNRIMKWTASAVQFFISFHTLDQFLATQMTARTMPVRRRMMPPEAINMAAFAASHAPAAMAAEATVEAAHATPPAIIMAIFAAHSAAITASCAVALTTHAAPAATILPNWMTDWTA